jgi:hypothetical protein
MVIPATSVFESKCSIPDKITIPDSYRVNSTDADLVIFVGFTESTSNFYAYSNFCVNLNISKRPVAGYLIINISKLSISSQTLEFNQNIFIHEVMHILGVNKGLFPYFPLNSKNENIFETDSDGRNYFKGDSLVEKSREHFACPSLSKLPLEDEGTEGTKGNHLESTIFGNEIMTPSAKDGFRLTKFSLSILQDSGW